MLLFTTTTIAISVTFTCIFNNTRGGILIATLLHGANNVWINYFLTDPPSEILGITIWSTIFWVALAAVLV